MTSVTLERKQELLLEARSARLSWIHSSSSPYRQQNDRKDRQRHQLRCDGDDHHDVNHDVALLKSSRVGEVMDNAISIVSMLYDPHLIIGSIDDDASGGTTAVAEGENGQKHLTAADITNKLRLSQQIIKNDTTKNGSKANTMTSNSVDDKISHTYRAMIRKFCRPECSDVVYAIKHFVGTFEESVQKLEKDNAGKKNNTTSDNDAGDTLQQKNIMRLASSVHNFLQTLYTTVYLHPLWNDHDHDNDDDYDNQQLSDEIKRALEIFVYSKCHRSIFNILSNGKDDIAMGTRLDFLQFVNPSHLDMHCLIDDNEQTRQQDNDADDEDDDHNTDNKKNRKKQTWRKRLAAPITTLNSIPTRNSPAQMLSCILEAYRQVNEALISISTEGDHTNDTNKADGKTKLPGADDLLPALILTTVAAQPSQIVSILKFIEGFATDEEMRGEAGYAYTNMYCAVQFIRELDLSGESTDRSSSPTSSRSVQEDEESGTSGDRGGGKKPSLSISPEDLQAMIKRSAARTTAVKAPNRNKNASKNTADKDTATKKNNESVSPLQYVPIPIGEVRAARLRGEEIYAWARRRWMEEKSGTTAESNNAFMRVCTRNMMQEIDVERNGQDRISSSSSQKQRQHQQPQVLPLPQGFTRTYNYVSTGPDDVRMSDIPSLLKEYRMLVLGLETFLTDQSTRQNEYRKEEIERARSRLEMDASEAEAAFRGTAS